MVFYLCGPCFLEGLPSLYCGKHASLQCSQRAASFFFSSSHPPFSAPRQEYYLDKIGVRDPLEEESITRSVITRVATGTRVKRWELKRRHAIILLLDFCVFSGRCLDVYQYHLMPFGYPPPPPAGNVRCDWHSGVPVIVVVGRVESATGCERRKMHVATYLQTNG